MKVYLILICGVGLAGVALGGPNRNPAPALRVSQPARMRVSQPARMQVSQPTRMIVSKPTTMGNPTGMGKPTRVGQPTRTGKPTTVGQPAGTGKRVAAISGKPGLLSMTQQPANMANRPTDVANTGSQRRVAARNVVNRPTDVANTGSQRRNVVNGPQSQFRLSKANGPQTQGAPIDSQLPPQPGNVVNGPQTDDARTGGELPLPQMATSTDQPLNMAYNSQNEPPREVMSTSYPANAENKSASEIAPTVKFKQNRRIQGSDGWVDPNYEVFRNYRSEWHDRDWWRSHYSRVAFGIGGWYYWNGGYWFPAWGYDPNAHFAYDGPIYAYHGSPPDQVIADVQEALQKQGYYQGEVDGLLGPPTRAALADYQRDQSLYTTSAIDSPTLQSLGMR
jgi:Putative peptidoglycan binding domain